MIYNKMIHLTKKIKDKYKQQKLSIARQFGFKG